MRIKHLTIENFKGLTHCEIDFEPGFNLLIGDNGKGKTSILEALSVALGGFLVGIDDISAKHFVKSEIRISSSLMGEGSFDWQYETPVMVNCMAEVNGQEYEWTRRKSSVRASRSTVEPKKICTLAGKLAKDVNSQLPVLNYQSAARTWMQKREQTENVFDSDFRRTVGYKNCLDEASDQKMLLNWCAKMEQVSWQKKKPIAEYEAVKNALSVFMGAMNGGAEPQILFDRRSLELSYIESGNVLPVRCLSAGYQAVIWMVLDIAYRMAVLNPNMYERAAETGGVVLIDELDMHLHPKWQWNIIDALQKTFPNVQFIAATHSPILIAACRKGHLVYVNGDEISYGETDFGMEVNDVLSYTQGSRAIAAAMEGRLNHIYEEIDEGRLKQAQIDLTELEGQLGEDHPEVLKVKTALDFELAVSEGGE